MDFFWRKKVESQKLLSGMVGYVQTVPYVLADDLF